MAEKKRIYLIQMNHFDPLWRRCWDRRFEYKGQSFASYAEIEQAVLDDWLSVMESEPTTFVLEQTVSLRKYLERRPDQANRLRQLAQEGRFELLASGEVIPDANMPLGESLVRNMLYGILWAEQALGVEVNIGCRNDGFGSPAQIPQIFRECEIKWLPFLSYIGPDNDYWQGLDGTCLYARMPRARQMVGSNVKLAPCDQCNGAGCSSCAGRGFDQSGRVEIDHLIDDLKNGPVGVIEFGGEETLPCMDIVKQVKDKTQGIDHIDYRFGVFKDVAREMAADIEAVDDPPPGRISSNPDIALSSAGCWVARIKLNQKNRAAEHALLNAETLATWAFLLGSQYPMEKFRQAWRDLVFTHFHDALTATHIDPAYDELMDLYQTIDEETTQLTQQSIGPISQPSPRQEDGRSVVVFNTMSWIRSGLATVDVPDFTGQWATARDDDGLLPVYDVQQLPDGSARISMLARDVEPLASSTITVSPVDAAPEWETIDGDRIENERFIAVSNEHGITSIQDRLSGRELIDYAHFYAGELILEHDYGDPWATRKPDHARERMSCFGKRVAVRKRGPVSEIVFEGQHPCNFHDFEVNWLTWRQRVIVADGLPYVEFVTEVDWDTHNRRLRIAFPTSTHTDDGDYEVPYGTIRRKRYDVRSYHPNGVNGDWPVTHWAAPASDKGSVAVLNRGECSYRIEGGNVLVSLLRSPTTPWCLYEPAYYRMPLFDGMRDSGKHSFSLALYPYVGDWRYTGVTEQAWGYNVPFVTACDRSAGRPMGISLKASGSMISTVKSAEDGEALVLRIFEYAGRGETVKLTLPQGYETVRRTNMLERAGGPLPASGGSCEIEMAPFKIVTLRLEK